MKMKACTHNGVFHADDVFAAAILRMVADCEIVRSRDPKDWEAADIVFDVGGQHDGEKWFDHHFSPVPTDNEGFMLSSAGMLWSQFGEKICGSKKAANYVRNNLIRSVDQIDNGNFPPTPKDPEWEVVTVSHVLAAFNPGWDDPNPDFDRGYLKALDFAEIILGNYIEAAKASVKVEEIVLESIDLSKESEILELIQFCPWEDEIDIIRNTHFRMVLFEDLKSGTWRLRTIPRENDPSRGVWEVPWDLWGKRGDEAPEGVDFVHPSGFIAGGTREGLLALARTLVYNQK